MLVDLPVNFRLSNKTKDGIKHCNIFLKQIEKTEIDKVEGIINQIGPDIEKLAELMRYVMTDKQLFLLVTAALPTIYVEQDLRIHREDV